MWNAFVRLMVDGLWERPVDKEIRVEKFQPGDLIPRLPFPFTTLSA